MIQIDDAGWGCLIGGVLAGVYRDGTDEFTYGMVAPKFFQGQAFAAKAYMAEPPNSWHQQYQMVSKRVNHAGLEGKNSGRISALQQRGSA